MEPFFWSTASTREPTRGASCAELAGLRAECFELLRRDGLALDRRELRRVDVLAVLLDAEVEVRPGREARLPDEPDHGLRVDVLPDLHIRIGVRRRSAIECSDDRRFHFVRVR